MRTAATLLAFFLAASAAAQPSPIIDPDDFVDPRQHDGPTFVVRVVAGAAKNLISDYRATGEDAAFIHLTTGVYWKNLELDYKRTEIHPEHDSPPVFRCGCNPPLYFPTPPPPDATPNPPPPGAVNTVQAGWYRQMSQGDADPPVMLRYRVTFAWQDVDTPIRSAATHEVVQRLSGGERSIGVEADTHFKVGERDLWGSVRFSRTSQREMVDRRPQQELAYTARLPAWTVGPILMRMPVTVASVTGRGAPGLNVVSPVFEAFWHSHATQVNLHFVVNPQITNDGAAGWRTRVQMAVFFDRGHVWLLH